VRARRAQARRRNRTRRRLNEDASDTSLARCYVICYPPTRHRGARNVGGTMTRSPSDLRVALSAVAVILSLVAVLIPAAGARQGAQAE